MFTAMRQAKEILDDLGIESWLDCGSLLWMYRDGACDPLDTDFSIKKKDTKKLMDNLDKFEKYDLTVRNIFGFPEQGVTEISLIKPSGYKVDIFITFFKGKWAYHVSTYNSLPSVTKFNRKHYDKLLDYTRSPSVSFGEPEYWKIPSDVEEYLESYFGKGWVKHDPYWTYDMAPCIDREWSERIK